MRAGRLLPLLAFGAVLAAHAAWQPRARSSGPWAAFQPDEAPPPLLAYVRSGRLWLGLSYATAAAFATFCLARLYENRRRAIAGTAGGLALAGFLYAAACFLLGCCGSPMLAVYLGLFGPRFLGFTGPLVFGTTVFSVAVGYACVTRKSRLKCGCESEEHCGAQAPPQAAARS